MELVHSVHTDVEGDGVRVTSHHRFGMPIDGGPDLNELSVPCGLLVAASAFSCDLAIEADFDTPAGILPEGRTTLRSEHASPENLSEALKSLRDHANLAIGAPELFSGPAVRSAVGNV